MLDVPICAGCGYIFFAPQEVCGRCGAPGPKPVDMEKAMRASLDMSVAMLLDPSLRPPQKPDPDWKETAAMLASALRFKRDDPTNPFCDAAVDCALLAYKTLLEADDG